jgi:hypothetical protein
MTMLRREALRKQDPKLWRVPQAISTVEHGVAKSWFAPELRSQMEEIWVLKRQTD